MNIEAVLVVTSACQTAIGQIGRGDEIVGLTRAFIYAGANSVLGSLWNISDEATAVLMKEFYANIKNLYSADALRQAQLKMINSKDFKKPYYWAAFNITGGL
jgi:CHAT domain-containing protein